MFAALGLPMAASAAEPDAQAKKVAAQKFRDGEAAFKKHDYAKAAAAFEEANNIAPHPAPLFNAAQSHQKAGNLVRAANLCARYLRDAPESDKRRSKANEMLAELRPKLGRIAVEGPDADRFEIDGEPVELDETFVDPGDHEVAGRIDGKRVKRKVSVVAGSLERVLLERPKAKPAVTAPTPGEDPFAGDPPDKDTTKKDEKPLSPAWVYGGLTLTAVLGGVTAWSGLDTNKARSEYDDNPTQAGLDDGQSKQSRTNLLLGATAAVGVTTGVIAVFFTNWGAKKQERTTPDSEDDVAVGFGPGFVSVTGHF